MIEFHSYASGSSGNLYSVSDDNSTLLLECGLPWKEVQKALNFKTSQVAGCLITHAHQDHAKSVGDLARHGVDVYASIETLEALDCEGYRFHILEPERACRVAEWSILPFPSVHDSPGSMGFLISKQVAVPRGEMFYTIVERLLFLTDTAYCAYTFPLCDIWAVECSYDEEILEENVREGRVNPHLANRMRASHMSLRTLKDMLRANDLSRLREVWLLHRSVLNLNDSIAREEIMKCTGVPVILA